ncbi:hypothetical protein OHT93_36525 [Streptomyces sp. NBC_00191]|uniref:hypothetical protein n=1 Tax=Streptomyces sp. NBC_00191 TaxID=2975674 RepID=UPI00324D74A4
MTRPDEVTGDGTKPTGGGYSNVFAVPYDVRGGQDEPGLNQVAAALHAPEHRGDALSSGTAQHVPATPSRAACSASADATIV